jgi:hypothetical protein
MKKYTYDFIIGAFTEDEADAKVTALKMLAIKLTAKELTKLAYIVEKDPIKTAMAKTALGV